MTYEASEDWCRFLMWCLITLIEKDEINREITWMFLMFKLLSLFKELPNNGVMLVYVSGDGYFGNAKAGEEGKYTSVAFSTRSSLFISGRCFIIACNVCFYDSWLVPSSLALPKTCKNQLVAYHKNCSHDSFLRRSFYLVRSLRTGRRRYEPQKNIKRGSSETNENKPEGCSLVRWVISIIVNYYIIYFFSEHESLLDSLFTASRPHPQK